MGTKHFSHPHDLTFYEESEEILKHLITKYNDQGLQLVCDGCRDKVVNCPAYFCQCCEEDYVLHKSCFELPTELNNTPHHSTDDEHPLILRVSDKMGFVCNCCRNFWDSGFTYSCGKCRINLDVNCALLIKSSSCDHQQMKNNILVTAEVDHFLDEHKLVLLYCAGKSCSVCNVFLSSDDACYGCLQCRRFLHRSCLEQVQEVIQHPYHPHPLVACSIPEEFDDCVACKMGPLSLQYVCYENSCDFAIHVPCANNNFTEQTTPRRLKISDHLHELYCFVPSDSIGCESICDKCHQLCEGAFYVCFECDDFNVHPKCMNLPPKVDHECHFHSLTLKNSFREDDSGVYICHACGEPRNGHYPLYFCEECPEGCPFTGHIECIISGDHEEESSRQIEPVKEDEEGEQKGDLDNQIHEIDSHDHQLTFHAKEGLEVMNCYECKTEIRGGKMYTCRSCSVHFHPSCTNFFPNEIIRQSLHEHPLHGNEYDRYICSLCRNVSFEFRYECFTCSYALDAECAFLTDDQCQNLKENHPEVMTHHFSHQHALTLAKCSSEVGLRCEVCRLPISGPMYCCLEDYCWFFLHESCLEMKQEIQPSYHLPHQLFAENLCGHEKICGVCKSGISYVGYSCKECHFFLHVKCATDLTSSLKLQFHEHNFYSFTACDFWLGDDQKRFLFQCCKCSGAIVDSFYRCVECDLIIHPECIPLPALVKHSCHVDPLTLRHSFCEDDSGVYVCDVCGEPRNPNHPVYLCEECWDEDHVFVAHVGCVIEEGDTSLEVLLQEAKIKDDQQETTSIEINQEE